MSVLAACQKQLQSELLLAEKEMHVRTEDGGPGPGGVQVRGTRPCSCTGRDVPDAFAEGSCALHRTAALSGSSTRLFRSVLNSCTFA